MKNIKVSNLRLCYLLFFFLFVGKFYAQEEKKEIKMEFLPVLNMSKGINIHIISPEPIQFVDLSSDHLIGDLPTENIARIKISEEVKKDSTSVKTIQRFYIDDEVGVITIVGQSFMAQYKVVYKGSLSSETQTNIHIQAEDMQPLEFPKVGFSNLELRDFSYDILRRIEYKEKPIRKVRDMGMVMKLNNVYVLSDYIFLDITFENLSNLSYHIDDIKFSIEDKKIYRATNNQSIEAKPVFKLFENRDFKKNFRNIYVFKKFTFPNSKVFKIRFFEEQFSGRTLEMKIKYSEMLKADTF